MSFNGHTRVVDKDLRNDGEKISSFCPTTPMRRKKRKEWLWQSFLRYTQAQKNNKQVNKMTLRFVAKTGNERMIHVQY